MSWDAYRSWQQESASLLHQRESASERKRKSENAKQAEEDNKGRLADAKVQHGALGSHLSTAQSDCRRAQIDHEQAAKEFSQLSIENAALNKELQEQKAFSALLANISNKYRKYEGITVHPGVVMAEKISAEELAHTDLLKVTCKENCIKAFDSVVSKITNFNVQDLEGKTALMYAIINGFYYGVSKLLQKGANVNVLDKQGVNALFYCTQIPHIKYLKQIAENTSDLNYRIPTFKNSTILHSLISNSRSILFASELNGELKDSNQCHFSVNKVVVDEDLTINCFSGERIDDGYTINQEKTLHILKYLVDKGANINAQNDEGFTPFFLACALKLKYLSKQLIDHYPIDWDLIDKYGYNALQWVLELKDTKLVKQMIDKGLDINHRDLNGNTTLFWAAKYVLPDIVHLLFNVFEAEDLANNQGLTAWDIATLNVQHSLIKVLISKKGIKKEFVDFWCAAKTGDTALVENLLRDSIDPNLIIDNYNNTTPLIQAVINKHAQIIVLLLKHGADINKPCKEEASPLYYSLGFAGQTVDLTIVQLLLAKGANVNQAMFDGDTPLHMASYQTNVGAMKVLLNNGAIIHKKNKQGKTPLAVLIEKQGLELDAKLAAVKYLLVHSTFPLDNDTVDSAKNYFPDVMPWLEHPENLPSIVEF